MSAAGSQPIYILQEGTQRTRDKDAQQSNIMAARVVADALKSTLGPKGMDKMLVDGMGDVTISNDGSTILKEVDLEHPAAKMVVEAAKVMDQECGDGTTTAVVLAGELLKEAQALLEQKVHPAVIVRGFQLAREHALTVLERIAEKVEPGNKTTLVQLAKTSIGGKLAHEDGEHLAKMAVEAVTRVVDERTGGRREVDLEHIKMEKVKGEGLSATQLVEGVVLRKERASSEMPELVAKAKVLLLHSALDLKKGEFESHIQIKSAGLFEKFLDRETKTLNDMADQIKALGATAVFSMKGINDLVAARLAHLGVVAVKNASKTDLEMLARATGASLVNRVEEASSKDLGTAGRVRTQKFWSDEYVFVEECPKAKAVTILVRGGSEHVVDEAERNLKDALSVVRLAIEDGLIVTGAGATAMELALALRKEASGHSGREALAIEAYANALEVVPRAIAENAGLSAVDMTLELRRAHAGGKASAGVDVFAGKVADMRKQGVIEPIRIARQCLATATEVATMILRIDDVIAAKTKPPTPPMPAGPHADY